jgi:hypothetical protein
MDASTSKEQLRAIAQAATEAGVTPRVVRGLIRRGAMGVVRMPGARPLVSSSELRAIVEASRIPARSN